MASSVVCCFDCRPGWLGTPHGRTHGKTHRKPKRSTSQTAQVTAGQEHKLIG